MKSSFLFGCILLFSAGLIAQSHRLLDAPFDSPTWSNQWIGKAVAKDGLANLSASDGSAFWVHEAILSSRSRFQIRAKLRFRPQTSQSSYGLVWDADESQKQYFAFQLQERQFRIIRQDGAVTTEVVPWTKHKKIKDTDILHEIRIEKNGWKLSFWFEDKRLTEITFPGIHGKYHGMLLQEQGSLGISQFQIIHPEMPIHLADGGYADAVAFPLDSTINSAEQDEWAMVPLAARNLFIWSRATRGNPLATQLFETHWEDTVWSEAAPMLPDQQQPQLGLALGPDQKSIWFASHDQIWSSYQARDSVWEKAISFELPPFPTDKDIHFSLSPDHKTLILAMESKAGKGKKDLYVSFRKNGSWTKALNLGSDLNTFGDELTPWLDQDGETLYFSSEGWPGYGRVDVFRSKRLSNTWTSWSEPENLGPGINGRYWDIWYRPRPEERRAYLSSQDSSGNYDIYDVRIPIPLEEQPVVRLTGNIRNAKTNALLEGVVQVLQLPEDSLVQEFETTNGRYKGFLNFSHAYEMYALVNGYFPLVDTLDLRNVSKFREAEKDLFVRPIEVGEAVQLQHVYFQRATAELVETSFPELDRLLLLMQSLPALHIEIRGHTDNIGEEADLLALSEARARRIRDYLIARGISADRIKSRGLGSSQPVASNVNPATRPLNRRVEFIILSR
ncbi:MAG: OmpA family protein [Bacteroidota bacterium]